MPMDDLKVPLHRKHGGARPGAGQPPYEPTQADRATVQNLTAFGATHAEIAQCIGTNGVSEKTLRKHFRRELTVSTFEVKALAMSKLVRAINDGEAWAICFYLKTKGGFRETSDHRFVNHEGKDRGLTLAEIDAAIAAYDADSKTS